MGSRDLQNWMHIGTRNRSWHLALPYELTATVDSLSANFIGGEGRGEVALRLMESSGWDGQLNLRLRPASLHGYYFTL